MGEGISTIPINNTTPITSVKKPTEIPQSIYPFATGYLTNIVIFSTALNSMTLHVLTVKRRCFPKHQRTVLMSLTTGNLICPLTAYPLAIISSFQHRWVFGQTGSIIHGFIILTCGLGSIFHILILSIERYISLVHPMKQNQYLKARNIYVSVLVAWTLAIACGLFPVLGWSSYKLEGIQISSSIDWRSHNIKVASYNCFLLVVCFFIPTTIIVFCNFKFLREVKRLRSSTMHHRLPTEPTETTSQDARGLISDITELSDPVEGQICVAPDLPPQSKPISECYPPFATTNNNTVVIIESENDDYCSPRSIFTSLYTPQCIGRTLKFEITDDEPQEKLEKKNITKDQRPQRKLKHDIQNQSTIKVFSRTCHRSWHSNTDLSKSRYDKISRKQTATEKTSQRKISVTSEITVFCEDTRKRRISIATKSRANDEQLKPVNNYEEINTQQQFDFKGNSKRFHCEPDLNKNRQSKLSASKRGSDGSIKSALRRPSVSSTVNTRRTSSSSTRSNRRRSSAQKLHAPGSLKRKSNRCQLINRIDRQMILLTALMTTAYCIAWLPYAIISILQMYGMGDSFGGLVTTIPAFLAKSFTIFDPIIYCFINKDFRRAVKDCWKKNVLRLFEKRMC